MSDSDPKEGMTFKVTKTVFMVLAPTVMGIYLELIGPTMQEFMKRVDADYEQISQALVARSVGYLLGSLLSGFLADRFKGHLDLLLSVAMLLGATGTMLSPWCTVLWLLAVMFLIQGLGQGMIDTSNNTLCLMMWGAVAAAPIHALHFGFGIGAFIAPMLARPFIHDNSTSNGTDNIEESPIEIPYSISAILCLVWFVIFLVFYVHSRMSKKVHKPGSGADNHKIGIGSKCQQMLSPGSCTNGDTKFGVMIFVLIFFFYLSIVGGERAFGKFIYSYATDCDLKFNSDDAAWLNSLFWICFTCGRGVSIVAAKFVQPKVLLGVELVFNVVGCVVLAVWGGKVSEVLWVFTGVLGFFLSPVFAAGMAFANQYLIMTGSAVALVFIGSSAGGMVYQYLTGYLFEYHGPQTLMYVMVGYACSLSIVFILMLVLVRGRGQLVQTDDDEDEDIEIKQYRNKIL